MGLVRRVLGRDRIVLDACAVRTCDRVWTISTTSPAGRRRRRCAARAAVRELGHPLGPTAR